MMLTFGAKESQDALKKHSSRHSDQVPKRTQKRHSVGHFLYTEQMDAEDLGRKLLLTPPPPATPNKA